MLDIVIGAFIIIEGIYQLVLAKPIGGEKNADKYTPESYRRANRICGVFLAAAGACIGSIGAINLVNNTDEPYLMLYLAALACAIVGLILCYVLRKRVESDAPAQAASSDGKEADSKKDSDHIDGYGDE